jgi:hypothetical protein
VDAVRTNRTFAVPSSAVDIRLKPGETWRERIEAGRIFDLSRHGKYKIIVSAPLYVTITK